ncbi:hypothetical protein FC70_GL000689 [Paucilactobacillus oligofermentans DSM 15707 = LMG 22743]|uniref:Uncharacterized protein n=2 Tax=Paucilactobacillus oligofermentans TaxID=293371 RepID=A0A0R1RLT4_9LACO|nr:hypothetical protein FC70_GL000689 [Paucilactobacillus oligofermentans DSM 15707 = LMG 22743]
MTMNKDYNQLLEQLRAGEITELSIEASEFLEFQSIFHAYEYRKRIKGQAMRGGQIIYRMVEN